MRSAAGQAFTTDRPYLHTFRSSDRASAVSCGVQGACPDGRPEHIGRLQRPNESPLPLPFPLVTGDQGPPESLT